MRYTFDDFGSLHIYYQMLGEIASKYGTTRSFVETVLCYAFDSVILGWGGSFDADVMCLDVDDAIDVKKREIEKAVRRWAHKQSGFEWWATEMMYTTDAFD